MMLSFPGLAYLDVQKTGSTFVRRFLLDHVARPMRDDHKHAALGLDQWLPAFRFSSCRDPFRQYLSLYNYGLGGKGNFHRKITARGGPLAESYDGTAEGFSLWLRAVLGPDLTPQIYTMARRFAPDRIGFQTARFLHLNLRLSDRISPFLRDPDHALRAYALIGLTRPAHVLHTETLTADLIRLVQGPLGPFLRDRDAALIELAAERTVNASTGGLRLRPEALPEDLIALLERKEAFLFQALSYPRYLTA